MTPTAAIVRRPIRSRALVALVTVAATLESVAGFCLGCTIFAALMRVGAIPESVCEECADISGRLVHSVPGPE